MYRLEVPDPLSGLDIDGDDTLGEQVIPRTHPTVVVVGRGAGRQVDEAQLVVDRHRPPDVRVPTVPPRLVLPGFDRYLVPLGDGVEDPLHLAGARVEPTYVSR